MWRSPAADERAAYLLNDVASAHDAGLTAQQILEGPATASLHGPAAGGTLAVEDPTLTAGLVRKGLSLAPHEILLLSTAEQAGTVAAALRNLAHQREGRAARVRELFRSLAYPAFLLLFGCGVSLLTAALAKSSLWIPLAIVGGLVGSVFATVFYVLRTVHRADGGGVPLVSPLVRNLGELPYLQSLHGLYAAGVKIGEAHDLALRTSPIDGVRMRLFAAGRHLAQQRTLAEALQEAGALHPETRQMLTAAEAAGELEDALGRAIRRRQDELERQTRRLTRLVVVAITVLVYGYAAYVILSFWMGRTAELGRILDR